MPMVAYSCARYCDSTLVENRQSLLEDARVEAACGPAVADVLDVEVAVAEHESARRVVAGLAGQPLEHQAGDGAAGVAGVGDRDRRPRGAVAAQGQKCNVDQ